MSLPSRRELAQQWNATDTNLERVLLPYEYYRSEEGYSSERPLIFCKDGGLLALYRMRGVDPEPLGEEELRGASAAVAQALEVLSPANFDPEWRGGTWEVQNLFARRESRPPLVEAPEKDSATLRYANSAYNDYFQSRPVLADELLWAFRFVPRFRTAGWLRGGWKFLSSRRGAVLIAEKLQRQAWMLRRTLAVVEETLLGFRTRRPRMQLGLAQLDEEQAFRALYRVVNHQGGEVPRLRTDLPLSVQIACSERDDTGREYRIDGRPTKVMTWKVPPSGSIGYLFARLQNEIRFPFVLAQTFRAQDPGAIASKMRQFETIASSLSATRHKGSAQYAAEAHTFLAELTAGAVPYQWYFSLTVSADTPVELEDRVARLAGQMRSIQSDEDQLDIQAGEPMEERANRRWADLSSVPGNGQYALRENQISSRTAGNLAMAFRLSEGDPNPDLLFGDRTGGIFGLSLFPRRETSWNKAVLGKPGSGKSVLMLEQFLALVIKDSQAYVLDRGNSFGPLFELLAEELPGRVAVMRLGSHDFRFNPLPLLWALAERARQKADGTYRMILPGGEELPCPVEAAFRFFEAWVATLIGQGKPLSPEQMNRLDRALKGESGKGGFFLEFESICRSVLRAHARGEDEAGPRPLSTLLTHLHNEAPDLVPAVELWTRPPRDRYFDSGTDTVASADYVYFELSGLEDDPLLVAPFVAALMGTIWKRIKDPRHLRQRKGIWLDEWWAFLAQPAFFPLADKSFREGRKFNSFTVLGSQSPEEVKDGLARRLLACMSEKFLFRGFTEPTFMRQDLQLEDHHLELHDSLREDGNRREVYYVTSSGLNRVLSIELPAAHYWLMTTDAEDKQWRTLFGRRFGLAQGIEHLVNACEGRTVGAAEIRLQMVARYAKAKGLHLGQPLPNVRPSASSQNPTAGKELA